MVCPMKRRFVCLMAVGLGLSHGISTAWDTHNLNALPLRLGWARRTPNSASLHYFVHGRAPERGESLSKFNHRLHASRPETGFLRSGEPTMLPQFLVRKMSKCIAQSRPSSRKASSLLSLLPWRPSCANFSPSYPIRPGSVDNSSRPFRTHCAMPAM